MVRWHRRKSRDDLLANSLRSHVECTWQIACTLTGDEATAAEVVRQVVGGTLPQPYRSRQRGLRLEVVIAATEAAAARVFTPLVRRVSPPAPAAALSAQASALQRAFSRRISWDVQAFLWATEVENIAESDVTRRLGLPRPGRAAERAALGLAYLDLRMDLDENCKAALQNVFRSSADTEMQNADPHLVFCALCHAEALWLSDLRSALLSLSPPMPSQVLGEAQRLVLGVTAQESYESARSDRSEAATQPDDAVSAPPCPSQRDSGGAKAVVVSATDEATAVGIVTTTTHCPEPAPSDPAAEPQNAEIPAAEPENAEIPGAEPDNAEIKDVTLPEG